MTKTDTSGEEKLWRALLCTVILLSLIVTVAATTYVSHLEYVFSYPSKAEQFSSLPFISQIYFRSFRFLWILALGSGMWYITLLFRQNAQGWLDVAVFSAVIMLQIVGIAALAITAIYMCNQTFTFRFQHM
jgi:hypothetical protein